MVFSMFNLLHNLCSAVVGQLRKHFQLIVSLGKVLR